MSRSFRYALPKLATASFSDRRISVKTLSKETADFLGLGLGSWEETNRSDSTYLWHPNERVVFAAVWQAILELFKTSSNSGLLLSNATQKLASIISGDSVVSSKGSPAELVIGASFLDSGLLGKKVSCWWLCEWGMQSYRRQEI